MDKHSIEYRDFRPGDENAIDDLYHRIFRKTRDLEQWKWEFLNTPEGKSIIRIIEDGGKVIGHIALIPMRFSFFGTDIIVGKSEDSSLLAEYRGKRLFGKLEKSCFDSASEKGFSIAYSISRTAREVHLKAGYHPLSPLKGYFISIEHDFVAEELSKFFHLRKPGKALLKATLKILSKKFEKESKSRVEGIKDISIEKIERFDDRADELFDRFVGRHDVITVKRSESYLNWRFVDNPNHDYDIYMALHENAPAGYIITTAVKRKEDFNCDLLIGLISDFLVLEEYKEALPLLFDKAVESWHRRRCDCVINWIQKDGILSDSMLKQLRRFGFLPMMGKFSIPISVRPLNEDMSLQGIIDQKNWFITLAMSGRWA